MKTANHILITAIIATAVLAGSPLASAAKPSRPPPPPPLTEPPARVWHGFADNGSAAADASRLYLFGGTGSDMLALSDLWYYHVSDAKWTLAPTGRVKPGPRQHMGFSCGDGRCVVANGSNGIGMVKETWIYTEESESWSKADCQRYPCPSARQMLTLAYDSARFYHLLFGGLVANTGTNLGDTYTFSNTTRRWTLQNPTDSPSARRSAAAAFVAGPVNRVVLLGGQIQETGVLCDMWSWTGTNWEEIEQTNWAEGPCLHSHSMAWDGARLVVTGGYIDFHDTPNEAVWTFEFTQDGNAGTWSYEPDRYPNVDECTGADVIHPGARMAYNQPSGEKVFFGGEEYIQGMGLVRYGDTTVCD